MLLSTPRWLSLPFTLPSPLLWAVDYWPFLFFKSINYSQAFVCRTSLKIWCRAFATPYLVHRSLSSFSGFQIPCHPVLLRRNLFPPEAASNHCPYSFHFFLHRASQIDLSLSFSKRGPGGLSIETQVPCQGVLLNKRPPTTERDYAYSLEA